MSFPLNFPPAILDTILGRLALLLMTGASGDLVAARHAARHMLAAYRSETENELGLAAEIVSFSFHAQEALAQAADPDMSLNNKISLWGSAVSLSRESHKAQRKLDQLQKARRLDVPAQPAEAPAASPKSILPTIEKALPLIEAIRPTTQADPKPSALTWTKNDHKRQAANRIADNIRKNQANAAAIIAQAAAPAACHTSGTRG